jgi:uncharacterized protein
MTRSVRARSTVTRSAGRSPAGGTSRTGWCGAGEDDEPGANGALVARGDLHRAPVLIAGVADIDGALRRVESYGGKVIQGKLPVPGMGWSAYVLDPEGNTIGLFQPDTGAGAGQA